MDVLLDLFGVKMGFADFGFLSTDNGVYCQLTKMFLWVNVHKGSTANLIRERKIIIVSTKVTV